MKKQIYLLMAMTCMLASFTACGGAKKENTEISVKEDSSTIEMETVELTKTSTSEIINRKNGYFSIEDENTIQLMNADGKAFISVESINAWKNLGDGYLLIDHSIYKDGEEIVVLEESTIHRYQYKDGILYYISLDDGGESGVLVAFNVETKEELWRIEGGYWKYSNITLKEHYIVLDSVLGDGPGCKLMTYDGETIVETSSTDLDTDEISDEPSIYTTASPYYIQAQLGYPIRVYDLDNKKVSESDMVLKEYDSSSEIRMVELKYVFPNGMYILGMLVLSSDGTSNEYIYKLYNINGEAIIESDRMSCVNTKEANTNVSVVETQEGYYMLAQDGTGIFAEGYDMIGESSLLGTFIDKYLILVKKENDTSIQQFIHIDSGNITELEESESIAKLLPSSSEGSYIICSSAKDGDYLVYDNEFNQLYTSSNYLQTVDEEYVLEIENILDESDNLFLVEIKTGKKTKLETEGDCETVGPTGLVTYDGEKYYLYAFR